MKYFYTRLLFVVLATFTTTLSIAQMQFAKGYIVLLNNDTLQGYIQDKVLYSGLKSISFKKEENTEELSYGLKDIMGFYFTEGNEIYISQDVDIDKKPIDINRLEKTMQKKIVKERVLLKVLVKGKADLFQYVDENNKQHFFFKKDSSKITELSYVRSQSASGQLVEFPEYKQQLTNLFSDCPKFSKRKYSFSLISLSKSFKEYNACMQSLSYSKQKQRVKIIPCIQFGIAFNYLKLVGGNSHMPNAGSSKYTHKQNSMIGAGFDIKAGKKSNPFTPTIEFSWRGAGTFTGTNGVTDPLAVRGDYSIDVTFLSANIGLKYVFTKSTSFQPFFKTAVGYRYLLSSNSNAVITFLGTSQEYEPLIDFAKSGYGIITSAGCTAKGFQLEIRYDLTKLPATGLELLIGSPMIIIGYSF